MPWRAASSARARAWPASNAAELPALSHSANSPAAEMRVSTSSRRASCSAWSGRRLHRRRTDASSRLPAGAASRERSAKKLRRAHRARRPGGSCRCRSQDERGTSRALRRRHARRLRARQVATAPRRWASVEIERGRSLAGSDARHDEHARVRTQGARGNAFFHAGDA